MSYESLVTLLLVDRTQVGILRAINYNSMLWGGVFNPIAFIDSSMEELEYLVNIYEVDCVINLSSNEDGNKLAGKLDPSHGKLRMRDAIYTHGIHGIELKYLSIREALLYHYNSQHVPRRLSLVAASAQSASPEQIYCGIFAGILEPEEPLTIKFMNEIRQDADLDLISSIDELAGVFKSDQMTIYSLSRLNMWSPPRDIQINTLPGFYYGNIDSVEDVLAFWNLRAFGVYIAFYDQRFIDKDSAVYEYYYKVMESIYNRYNWSKDIPIMWISYDRDDVLRSAGEKVRIVHSLRDYLSSSIVAHQSFARDTVYFSGDAAASSEMVQMTEPFNFLKHRYDFDAHIYVVRPSEYSLSTDTVSTISLPTIDGILDDPVLLRNHYLANTIHTKRGVGYITSASSQRISLQHFDREIVLSGVFRKCGYESRLSLPGKLMKGIITKFGGLQSSRILKIDGLRALLTKAESGSPQSIKKIVNKVCENCSVDVIRKKYEGIYIEGESMDNINRSRIGDILLKKDILIPGYSLVCERCQLTSWCIIDEVRRHANCQYCDHKNNYIHQLSRANLVYKINPIMTVDDKQFGALPAIVTLMALDAFINSPAYKSIIPSFQLLSDGKLFLEVDFVVLCEPGVIGGPEIIIGEVKTSGEQVIEKSEKHIHLLNALEDIGVHSYLMLSKTSKYADEELEAIKINYASVIDKLILVDNEMVRKYRIYEDCHLSEPLKYSSRISDLPRMTQELFPSLMDINI